MSQGVRTRSTKPQKRSCRGDGRSVSVTYDAEDRAESVTITRGTYTFTWDAARGQLESVTAPDGGELTFGYVGTLLESASWSGAESADDRVVI